MNGAIGRSAVEGCLTSIDGIDHYRIDGVEALEPFLTTVVSDTDLWMFVSSSGALTAGRVDADNALFPYETDDRLHRAAGITGPLTVVARLVDGRRELWRPFDRDCAPECTRSIAKSVLGDRLVLEERHRDWGLAFRMTWAPSSSFGWVRTAEVVDLAGTGASIEVLDGMLDVMPPGVGAVLEQVRSNLVDSYKRSETGSWGTVAVYTLESLVTDRAEPAEALTATAVWSSGFAGAVIDLDERSVAEMVAGRPASGTTLTKGRRGAYLLRGAVTVPAGGSASWMMVADVGLDHAELARRIGVAAEREAATRVREDIAAGSQRLRALLDGADGHQSTADPVTDAHHLSNVLFNSMRGGVFPHGYRLPVADFLDFLRVRNREVYEEHLSAIASMGEWVDTLRLRAAASAIGDPDLLRLTLEYLPLTFSRRHGDPSRPWNRFSIRVRDESGDEVLSYEGNWRDIFQNWEALLQSFPAYFPNVVAKFVNATTVDGNNPYRIGRDGIDWEVPDPSDPWSHIGYWGDHQIVYLLRLLEAWGHFDPGGIGAWLDHPVFVYADVPYSIADHDAMVRDPRNTIRYDEGRAAEVAARESAIGSDGRLVVDRDGRLVRVGLLEKLLVPALAKLTSYVPGGGIWLNTQRPEWNDANNALAGFGLSMVTLFHLTRYLGFLRSLAAGTGSESVAVSAPVAAWLRGVRDVLERHSGIDVTAMSDQQRRAVIDELGLIGSAYRSEAASGFDPSPADIDVSEIDGLCSVALEHLGGSIEGARRPDGLYDSYNLVSFAEPRSAQLSRLGPMLEGQVAALSSGALDAATAVGLVDALFASDMYRQDQSSFMLYPLRTLPPFLERNVVPVESLARHPVVGSTLDRELRDVFSTGPDGTVHFRPGLINADALAAVLDRVGVDEQTRAAVNELYEEVFRHHSFTGRSSAMYGYEGIGSIYWHMVAKLLVAVAESYWAAVDAGEPAAVVDGLARSFRRVRSGLGFRKDPLEFGAFPTDCYSHTPLGAGARQPGMTGQVKEEILTRFAEIGLRVQQGQILLEPGLLDTNEVVRPGTSAMFHFCTTPMTVEIGERDSIRVVAADGRTEERPGLAMTPDESAAVFSRAGSIAGVVFTIGNG